MKCIAATSHSQKTQILYTPPPRNLHTYIPHNHDDCPACTCHLTAIPNPEILEPVKTGILAALFLLAFVCMIGCMLALAIA